MEMIHISKAEFDRISPEYARENHLAYLERVETSIGDFALPDGDTINAARA